MLHYSFSTILMSFLTSALPLALVTFIFSQTKLMVSTGYRLLTCFIGFIILRLLLPVEFPFTINVILPNILSQIVATVRHSYFSLAGIDVSLWTIFEGIWLIGALIGVFLLIRSYQKTKTYLFKYGTDVSDHEKYASIMKQICSEKGKRNRFHIIELPTVSSPLIYGITTPYILLPADNTFMDKDLYFVLSHEAAHYFHHDLILKFMFKIIMVIYWWNPLCILLNQQVNTLLEMRVDDGLTRHDPAIIASYLDCILRLMKSPAAPAAPMSSQLRNASISFYDKDTSIVQKRFQILVHIDNPGKKRLQNLALIAAIVIMYAASYLFIFEASCSPDEIDSSIIELTDENCFFIQNPDGSYDLYIYGQYIETVYSLEGYPSNIKIILKEDT